MQQDPTNLLNITGISNPLIGFYDKPKATIGGTDIAMRPYLPCDTLAFTVTKPMFEQLCRLDEKSFLHKSFWNNVKQARVQPGNASQTA